MKLKNFTKNELITRIESFESLIDSQANSLMNLRQACDTYQMKKAAAEEKAEKAEMEVIDVKAGYQIVINQLQAKIKKLESRTFKTVKT